MQDNTTTEKYTQCNRCVQDFKCIILHSINDHLTFLLQLYLPSYMHYNITLTVGYILHPIR